MKHSKETAQQAATRLKISSKRLEAAETPCPYCGRVMSLHSLKLTPTKEHIKPKARFGNGEKIMVCLECNRLKGSMTLEEFLEFLQCWQAELNDVQALLASRLIMIDYLVKSGLT